MSNTREHITDWYSLEIFIRATIIDLAESSTKGLTVSVVRRNIIVRLELLNNRGSLTLKDNYIKIMLDNYLEIIFNEELSLILSKSPKRFQETVDY